MSETLEAYEYRSADLREARGSNPANVAAVELLQKRVARLEARIDHIGDNVPATLEWLTVAVSRDGERLNAIERGCYCHRGLDPSLVEQNTREYYEQQIEEMSAKWEKADQDRQYAEDRYQLWMQRAIDAESRCKHVEAHLQPIIEEKARMAATIAELREKIGSRDAIIAQKNRELEVKYSYHSQIMSDAKLGAMVRQMDLSEFPVETCAKILECVTGAKSTYNGQEL